MKCHNLSSLKSLADEGTLVVSDIDETLITLRGKILNTYWYQILTAHFGQLFEDFSTQHLGIESFSRIHLNVDEDLVNEDAPEAIRSLQSRNIAVIALTSRSAGQYGEIPDIGDFCYQRLSAKGIDFSGLLPDFDNGVLVSSTDYPSIFFKNGIIFTANQSKGDALALFLNLISQTWLPQKIIFIDNELGHLRSVEKMLKHNYPGVKFIGLHHTLEEDLRKEELRLHPLCDLDLKVAQIQVDQFRETGVWLHDAQAKQLIPSLRERFFRFICSFRK